MASELLQQVRVIDPVSGTDQVADVLIADGYIKAIGNNICDLPDETQIRDGQGLVLGPGLVDLYSHSGEPGFEERETLSSLTAAAAAGGFTRLNVLPDTSPPIDNVGSLPRYKTTAKVLHFWGALTLGLQGQQMTELAELAPGVVGFSDGQPLGNLTLVRRLLEYLQPLGKPVALWACDRTLMTNGVMREGPDSIRFGLPGNPPISETIAVAALVELVATTGTPIHLMRISTERSVKIIADAKSQGLPITASTTWMHLLLDTNAVKSYNPSLRLEPPLGNKSDVAALRQAVQTGIIDAVAIDHSPYTYEEKTVAFAEAPPGAIGLELALPLLWQHLVATGTWTAVELWQVLSTRPAQCLQQQPATVAPNQPAELTLFDPEATWTVNPQNLHTLSTNTPWLGQQLTGRVLQTWN